MISPSYAQFLPPTNMPDLPNHLPGAKKVLNSADQLRNNSNADTQKQNSSPAGNSSSKAAPPAANSSAAPKAGGGKATSADQQAVGLARKGQIDDYKNLVEHGANPSAVDSSQSTALHYASYRGDAALVDYLLERKGIIINAVDDRGNTPLHLAASNGREEIVRKLITAGADSKLKNSDGYTPLLRACAQGESACVKALLESGSSASEVDSHGRNARQVAEKFHRNKWEEVLQHLNNAPAPSTP